MSRDLVYLKPPTPPRRKRAKPKTPAQEVQHLLHRYRHQLAPAYLALWVGLLAVVLGPMGWYVGPALAACATGTGWYLVTDRWHLPEYVPVRKVSRPVERWYVAACTTACSLWFLLSTLGGAKPSPRAVGTLLIGATVCAGPWWHHRRIRGSVPVRFDDLTGGERAAALGQARSMIKEWTAFTSAGHAQGAHLNAITFNPWSVAIAVVLRRGATVGEFTPRRLEKLESAFGAGLAGGARVERVDRQARLAVFRFMIRDPHAAPIRPPETGQSDAEKAFIGLFETGEQVLFLLVNTLIGGMSGAGKSSLFNVVIRALARMPSVAVVGIDMKPGAPTFGKWAPIMHALAKTPEEAKEVLDQLLAGLTHRGDLMSGLKSTTWRPTPSQPFIVLLIDEVQEIKHARLMPLLDRITAIIRGYGGCVVLATQHPTAPNVSSEIKAQCKQRIGMQVESASADRVIFGEQATRTGWRASTMIPPNREGSFLIKSPEHRRPMLARAWWLSDDDVDAEAATLAPLRTAVDSATWTAVRQAQPAPQAIEPADIVDAVVVDDDPADKVLAAIGAGATRAAHIAKMTGQSSATVYRHLKRLREQGAVAQEGRDYVLTEPAELSHERV